jgi:predicted metal-dependent hydrolase
MLISMDARLREGIRLFNAGRYFESHERFEELYVGAEEQHKPFIEGLIQLAAACRLVCDFGEIKGPVRMVHQALIRLENYQPTYLQVRVKGLIAGMEAWAKRAEAAKPAEVDRGAVREEIPKIRRRRFLFFG